MKKAKFSINGIIGEKDPMLLAFGVEEDTISAKDIEKFINDNKEADTFEIEIRSNGGSVSQGFDIYDQLVNSGKRIITKGYRVNSIATVIFMAGHDRLLSKNAEFIVHNPWIDASNLSGQMLTASALQEISDDVKATEDKLFDFYADKLNLRDSGKVELRNLMDEDNDMGAAAAIEMGFATGFLESNKKAIYTELILNKYTKVMSIETEKISGLEKSINKILNFLTKKHIKNQSSKLEDGSELFYDGELEVGLKVFSDEALSEAAKDGKYTLENGDVLDVKDGAIAEIIKAEAENKEVEDLKAKVAELETIIAASETEKTAQIKDMEGLKIEVAAFKKIIIGAEKKKVEVRNEDLPDWRKRLNSIRNNEL